jgi:hypothetical protein
VQGAAPFALPPGMKKCEGRSVVGHVAEYETCNILLVHDDEYMVAKPNQCLLRFCSLLYVAWSRAYR